MPLQTKFIDRGDTTGVGLKLLIIFHTDDFLHTSFVLSFQIRINRCLHNSLSATSSLLANNNFVLTTTF